MNPENFTILLILLCAVLALCLVLLVVLLRRGGKRELDTLLQNQDAAARQTEKQLLTMQGALSDEFSRCRMENAQSQSESRRVMTAALGEMSGRVEKMTRDNYAFHLKTSQTISDSLRDLQKGHEEKLEKIRMTVD